MARHFAQLGEVIPLAMVCLAPWAFGAVTAWAEFGLYLGVASVALLSMVSGRGVVDRVRALTCIPSLALIGLVLLAMTQATAWPGRLLGHATPSAAAFLASLAPDAPAQVLGDQGPPVSPPGPMLSESPEMTADAGLRLLAGWVLFQAVAGAGMGSGAFRRFGVAMVINGVLLTLFAVVQSLSWNGRMYWTLFELSQTARGGPFINRNHLASYLNLGLGFALAALLVPGAGASPSEGRGRRLAAAYCAGLLVVGVIASFSRGGFVAMVAAMLLLLSMARPRNLRIAGGLAAMLGLAAAFLWSVGAIESYQRIATMAESDALDGRLECWKGAIRAWSTSPAWGLGLGTFASSVARFFDRDSPIAFMHAESDYFEILAEGGTVGLALGLILLGSLARLGFRALAASSDPVQRIPILGALFGLASLAIHGLSDFPLRIPAIAVTVVVLAAHLTRAGLAARGPLAGEPALSSKRRVIAGLIGLATAIAALISAQHGWEMARSEAAMAGVGIPPAGFEVPTTTLWITPESTLERARLHLEESLRYRPDWAEGHARLGLLLLSQYRTEVAELVRVQAGDPARAGAMADPLWFHKIVHSATADQLAAAGGVLDQEPVRRFLAPAARSFLEARRCCPVWGLPHAELASLDYLIAGGETTSDHARRALDLAGNDLPTIAMAARAAAQGGDLRLVARGWRRILQVRESSGDDVADQARVVLTPQQILDWVLPDGRAALRFADRIYRAPEDRPARDRLLNWAADRLPRDLDIPEADRLRFEARAHARLGREGLARERMEAALALEPDRPAWRREFVEWLVGWGKLEEAHDQALIGLHFAPTDPDARRAVELAAEALSRGAPPQPPR